MTYAPLLLSPYSDGVTWWLFRSAAFGDVRVPSGFETDFASVPRPLQGIFPRWGDYGPASILHDWLYWSQRGTRQEADDAFLQVMTNIGVEKWKRATLWAAVRAFGWIAWRDNARLAREGFSRMHATGATSRGWKRRRLLP